MTILNMLAAAIVLWRGIRAINHMSRSTELIIRTAWLLVTLASAAALLAGAKPTWPQPTWPDLALHWGIAVLMCIGPRALIFCSAGGKS